MKKPLIVLAGPTAVGKTELSIALAKMVGGSVVSADSMQAYRHMDIGSAKIKPREMQGIPHYMIDILEPYEECSVALFQSYALRCMEEIYRDGRIPIIVGGSGFYIQAILYGVHFEEQHPDAAYRAQLEEILSKEGRGALHRMLGEVDPEAAAAIHENNVKRVMRALEYHKLTGQKISRHNEEERKRRPPYRFAYFVLNDSRERIYRQIDERVDAMMEQGLEEEVRKLRELGCRREMVSMQGLGYKEMMDFLDGKISREEAVRRIKRDTRHFAKRQLTWFRREKDAIWIEKQEFSRDNSRILAYMKEELDKRKVTI